jgi:two-component sensor histidine kinase
MPVTTNVVWFNSMFFTGNNEALIATNAGLRKLKFDKNYNFQINNQPCEKAPFLNSMSIEDVRTNMAGDVYIAGAKNLYKFDRLLLNYTILQEPQSQTGGEWLSNVLQVYEDNQNNLWLGCQQGLAFISKHKTPFQAFYQDKVTKNNLEHVMSIWKSKSDSLLVGLQNGLALINKNTGHFAISNLGYTFHHIFEDPFGQIHVSRSDGMFIYQKGKLTRVNQIYPEFTPYVSSRLNSHVFFSDSIIILGTEDNSGVLVWNFLNHQIIKIDERHKKIPLASGIVNTIFLDKKKNLWVLSDNTINIISENFATSTVLKLYDSINKQFAGLFFDMCESNKYYWIASYGTGIIQLDSSLKVKQIYNTADGLTNDGVYQIYPYENNIIITTNNGLTQLNLKTRKFQKYYQKDGLHSNGFEEAAGMMKDGLIYAGGIKGFTTIDPELFSGNDLPPKLYIDQVILETTRGKIDTSNLYFQSFTIPNNTLQTNIYFSALNYNNPTRTTYAYRIIGKSKDWIDLSTFNFVTLVSQPPGTYHLQVKAANEDGVWSEPKELILIFEPKWYQTWWFYLLIALTIAGILYALYRYRISQIKKQHEIRKNIATDLHDDLGSTLNSVKVFTNLAISGVKQEESLQQVKDNLTEATMSLRDMIWVLDDSLDTVDELITRLKQFAVPVATASNIETIIKADSEVNSRQLTKEEKRNLFLICKEAINNSIKYAGATQINVDITPSAKKIKIVVADNGKGFNVDEVKKGYGLKNMQYRAGQIRFKVVLKSLPNQGTNIIILPL